MATCRSKNGEIAGIKILRQIDGRDPERVILSCKILFVCIIEKVLSARQKVPYHISFNFCRYWGLSHFSSYDGASTIYWHEKNVLTVLWTKINLHYQLSSVILRLHHSLSLFGQPVGNAGQPFLKVVEENKNAYAK